MDKIFLKDLRIEAIVGVWDWERKMPQKVSIDLQIATDNRKAAASDNIEDALNYKLVAQSVVELVKESKYQLIETMAEGVANLIMTEFGVPWVQVSVCKPYAINGARDVGVVIERGEYA
jgi:dihydroneopterin aldolase